MRVLIAVPWYKPYVGGVVIAVERVAHALQSRGHELSILAQGDSDQIEHVGLESGVRHYSFNLRPWSYGRRPLRERLAWLTYLQPTIMKLRAFINAQKTELLIVHFPGTWSVYFAFLKLLFGVKYIVCVHGSDIHTNIHRSQSIFRATRLTLNNAEMVIASSAFVKSELSRAYPKFRKPVELVTVGVEQSWLTRQPRRVYQFPGRVILSHAVPIEVKGADVLLRAFAKISASFPDLTLALIGGARDSDQLNKLIQQHGVTAHVSRLGMVAPNDLPKLLEQAAFAVIASRREGLALFAVEAQLAGKVVIAAKAGSLPEIIDDQNTGLLFDGEDSNSLAEKMSWALTHAQECEKIGHAARHHVLTNRSLAKTADAYARIIGQVVSPVSVGCANEAAV